MLIDNLPFTLGELLALLGVGMVMGALIGQNKQPETPLLDYLTNRTGSLLTCFILLSGISIAYEVIIGDSLDTWTIAGILGLPTVGGIAGFLVGKDK